jgi:hypothetical protein
MTKWIRGRKLLDPPYNLTESDLFEAVIDGSLVPLDKQGRRVFPNDDLEKKYERLLALQLDLDEAEERFLKSDEDRIADRKLELDHGFVGNIAPDIKTYIEADRKLESEPESVRYRAPDLKTYKEIELPRLRQKESQIRLEYPAQIEKLENDLAPNRVWKDMDSGPAQQEALMERLLDVWYLKDEVDSFCRAASQKHSVAATKPPKLKVSPVTQWKDIKITLLYDETVRIKTPDWEEPFDFSGLGISHKRNPKKATRLWTLLKLFAQNAGFISRDNPDYDRTLPDTAKALNKRFKELFGINDSIYQGHYKKEKGYRTKIFFSDQTSVLFPDARGPSQNQATGTPSKIIEGKDEIKAEIEDLFAEEQAKVPQ